MAFDRKLNVVIREVHVNHREPPAQLPPPVTRSARVVVTDAGVAVDDDQFIRREDIVQGYFQPRSGIFGTVRLLNASGDLVLDTVVQNAEEATELLRALGRDVTQSRATFVTTSPLLTVNRNVTTRTLLIGILAMIGVSAAIAPALAAYFTTALLLAFMAGVIAAAVVSRVEVGIDGVFVRWFGTRRFIGYERIVSLEATKLEVRLGLVGGGNIAWTPNSADTRDALAARIEAARAAFARRADAADLAARVTRGERAVSDWRASLVQLGTVQEGGYRDGATRKEDLWRVVEDAGAPEEARAGAAVALRKEEGAAPRLRIVANAVASPRLRIALEAAADPSVDERAIDAALSAVSARN